MLSVLAHQFCHCRAGLSRSAESGYPRALAEPYWQRRQSVSESLPRSSDTSAPFLQSMVEFSTVGAQCSMPSCRQQDFLPFTCDCCKAKFCLEHRSYAAHNCSAALSKDMRAFVCPLCDTGVKVVASENINQTFDRHLVSGECERKLQREAAAKAKRRTCPCKGCKELMTISNRSTCSKCRIDTCLRHRLPESHDCSKLKAQEERRAKDRE